MINRLAPAQIRSATDYTVDNVGTTILSGLEDAIWLVADDDIYIGKTAADCVFPVSAGTLIIFALHGKLYVKKQAAGTTTVHVAEFEEGSGA